jgi:hypothetical protein
MKLKHDIWSYITSQKIPAFLCNFDNPLIEWYLMHNFRYIKGRDNCNKKIILGFYIVASL